MRLNRILARLTSQPSRRTSVISSSSALVLLGTTLWLAMPALSRGQVDRFTTVLLFVAAASAWNMIGGIAGQFSLANSAFIGVGGYVTVMLLRHFDCGVIPTLLASAGAGGLLALVMGAILFRLREAHFVIGSMAVALAALTWMINWDFTEGATGISAPISVIPGREDLYLMALAVAALALLASIATYHSIFGLRLMAVRDDEDVADSLGLSPIRLKLAALTIAGVLTATVGGIVSLQQVTIEPYSMFSLNWSMIFIVMAVVGGMGSVWGPALGAILVYYGLVVQLEDFPTFSVLIEGVLLIVLMKVLPGGIVGGITSLRARIRRRVADSRSVTQNDTDTRANSRAT